MWERGRGVEIVVVQRGGDAADDAAGPPHDGVREVEEGDAREEEQGVHGETERDVLPEGTVRECGQYTV